MARTTSQHTGAAGGAGRRRSRVIRLDETLDITTLQSVHAQWLEALDAERPLVLDAGRVQHIDCAALQLLCALWRAAPRRGVGLRWRDVSPVIRDAAALAGLVDDLGLLSPSVNPT